MLLSIKKMKISKSNKKGEKLEARIEELENKLANSKRIGETYKAWLQEDLKGIGDFNHDQIRSELFELINRLSPKDSWLLLYAISKIPTGHILEVLHKKLARYANDEI